VFERLNRDIEQVTGTAQKANQVADNTARGLLKWLLPNPPSISKELTESRGRIYQHVETVVSTAVDLFFRSDAWTREVSKRRQQESAVEYERRMKISKVESFFDSLNYEDLIPLLIDYKLLDLDQVIQKWNSRYAESQQTGPPKRVTYRIIDDNENK
jgi:hypothetical protein